MKISDEAVLAGAAAIQVRLDKSLGLNDLVRAVLDAASPHLMAKAWTEGAEAVEKSRWPFGPYPSNPYLSGVAAE